MSISIAAMVEKINRLPPLNERVPEPTPFKLNIPKYPGGGNPGYFEAMIRAVEEQLLYEFIGRKPEVEDVETREIHARHSHETIEPKPVPGCIACSLEERRAAGKPTSYYLVRIGRDKLNGKMVEIPLKPKVHLRRRTQSLAYHNRVQKKWNKAAVGKTELGVEREAQVWRFSHMQCNMFHRLFQESFYPPYRRGSPNYWRQQ